MSELNELLASGKLSGEVVEIDPTTYQDSSEARTVVAPGKDYDFEQIKADFEVTNDGYLRATMSHKIVGGDYDGAEINYDRVSNKTFERSGIKVSMMGDHIRALGFLDARPKSHADYGALIVRGNGHRWRGHIEWEAYCRVCKKTAFATNDRRNPDFPRDANGNRLTRAACPNGCKAVDKDGAPVVGDDGVQGPQQVYANERITRRIVASPVSAQPSNGTAAPAPAAPAGVGGF